MRQKRLRSAFFLGCLGLLCGCAAAKTGDVGSCSSFNGEYEFFGAWKSIQVSGDGSTDTSAFRAANPAPRIDRYGFLVLDRSLVSPRTAFVRVNPLNGEIHIDVKADGRASQKIEGNRAFPLTLVLSCEATRWSIMRTSQGGGDNVPSKVVRRVQYSLSEEGNLVVEGNEVTTTGYFVDKQMSVKWVAEFAKKSVQ